MSQRQCEGQVALVTGASKGGTGTAIALRLAAEGARVAITARSVDGLEATQDRIRESGGQCVVLPSDLSDPHGARTKLVERTEAALGPVDILVNKAAVGGYGSFESVPAGRLERALQVNLWAPWLLTAEVIGGMRERGHGAILNLTTFSAELPPGPPFPTNKPSKAGAMYGATKAALNRLTVSVASECEGQGIAVNALAPQGAIATPSLVAAGWVEGVMLEPLETMAEAALALCTGDPDRLTGRIAFSLQLLVELRRPVFDLLGESLVDGWQPEDLPDIISRQEQSVAGRGWPDAYTFGRVHSPRP
ncbi:MAG: SDR family oxidoreductase [Acidimicrobiaceae bacterium]|nr:SDR family oxidoreductase [Acidimicrobiaceae bacterium]MXY12066.1 SDR family oxidoreductase [Acidimicrobiaceae bacterium]MXZ67351.1 SDR family oxidoreductase [Acidimicrobiaceae bacterium]MYF33912.1 SDR family oxidoreductase [Acidimicrobiaceae bacterium]MYG80199.1 SDR family oxidoreductase [Acidimicrobiaceae bacterium]